MNPWRDPANPRPGEVLDVYDARPEGWHPKNPRHKHIWRYRLELARSLRIHHTTILRIWKREIFRGVLDKYRPEAKS